MSFESPPTLMGDPFTVRLFHYSRPDPFTRQFGNAWVVLKGHQTLVGRTSGEIFVNSTGNPHLAQGGSGDVLAGFIAGLLAQPALLADVGKTIRYAVWRHGAAADKLSVTRPGWVVEDLIGELGGVP